MPACQLDPDLHRGRCRASDGRLSQRPSARLRLRRGGGFQVSWRQTYQSDDPPTTIARDRPGTISSIRAKLAPSGIAGAGERRRSRPRCRPSTRAGSGRSGMCDDAGRDRDEGADRRQHPGDEDDARAVPAEQALHLLDVVPVDRQPAAVAIDEAAQRSRPIARASQVPEIVAGHRARASPATITPGRPSGPLRGAHAGDRQDHLGRDRREDRLQQHQQEDADIAAPVDQPDRPRS